MPRGCPGCTGWDQSHENHPTGWNRPRTSVVGWVEDQPMPQVTRVICFTAALVAVTACGSQNAVTGPGSTTAPTSVSQPSVFPLTITRTGGIAGFQDVLVVARDGMVSI